MVDTLFMKVYVEITGKEELRSPVGNIVMIGFEGRIESDYFNGKYYPMV